ISTSACLLVTCVYSRFFFSSRRRHTRSKRDWSSDVCSSDLPQPTPPGVVSDMARLFGTDGVRGLANQALTAPMAMKLGAAAATVLTRGSNPSRRRQLAIVGRDPRVAGEMRAAAPPAGPRSQGGRWPPVGVLPPPPVACLPDDYGADIGVMISASHNPMPDNGIKFFAAGGTKLDDAVEKEIEHALDGLEDTGPTGTGVGRIIEEA